MATPRRRLDVELVRRNLTNSTAAAQELITSGRVLVAGALATQPARLVSAAEAVIVEEPGPNYASRAGHKLAAALEHFGIDPSGMVALDVGASTGGFTDCLLQAGAKQVVAIDVGRGQLLSRLANDPRVVVKDRCNVRHLWRRDLTECLLADPDLVTADLSFIALRTVMPNLADLCKSGSASANHATNTKGHAEALLLVKPQFELSRQCTKRSAGVITDPALWRQALDNVAAAAAEADMAPVGEFQSPLRGAAGNTEFFLHLRVGANPK